jgi:arginyl-tRNA synthetase
MGQIISELNIRNPEWSYFDPDYTGEYPEDLPFTYDELEKIYPEASAACKEDKDRLELAKQATFELQEKRRGYVALWEGIMVLSRADMKKNFDSLGVSFELWKGEADIYDFIEVMAKSMKDKGIAVESDGALVIPVAEEGDNKEVPPLMYYKSDGAVTYGTTDLATIYDRVNTYSDLERIVYVVDHRQSLHFEQVFRSAKKASYVDDVDLIHIGYGTLNGTDGKPFKTRSGGVMKLSSLVEEAREKAMDRLKEASLAGDMSEDEKNDIAAKVANAAIKFADLSNQPHVDYIFDMERMVSFEGRTGPYVMYQVVRIKSLLRKVGDFDVAGDFVIDDGDRELALLISEFPDYFNATLRNYSPHHLCEYAYRLANQFSSFYAQCHIMSEKDEAVRVSRIRLCKLTHDVLEKALGLLGISVPERM